ncbi:PaaI family thioesterase [Roseobacter sp. YSTF-M11]|uniref:PaaI family thioesterase n=1 Tax=Roseobacter insulae TaxID=2859783 RepID=A0A9X1FUC8_9RHOB|nr:PaaI family thioesterase [Roseobacter insulae]MBW4707711.1 PaaI family thioesterase [Roseobacter insulae]
MPIARSPADLPPPQMILKRSGLEFMQAILSGEECGPPIGETMGFTLTEVSEGRAVFSGTPEFNVTNPMGTVHGGWYGALLDSALGCSVMTCVPRGSVYTTLEYKVNILRNIPIGTAVVCTADVDHAGRSTGVAHGEIRGRDDGRLYATGSTTCIIMKMT